MPHAVSLRRFLAELRRRRIFRVAAVYAAVGWVLVEVADTVSAPLSMPPWFATFVIVMIALGFPIAVALAWAFDITRTEPSPGERIAGATGGEPPRSMKWSLSIAALVLAVAGGLALRSWPGRGAELPDQALDTRGIESIAVLPFVNISSDLENEHFSDGLTEELLNSLAQIQDLRVAARTSSFAFKGSDLELPEIGKRLGVETVLEGSVRKADGRLRVTAQLVKVSDGYHLWSKTYEQREVKEIFEIQDEISAAIVESLAPRFAASATAAPHHATENVDAYDLYLRARYRFWQGSTEAGLREAAELYEKALELDPGFSLAWAGLSDAYMLLANIVPPGEAMPEAKEAAERALELDPRLAEGFVALASINWLFDWDWAAADQNYRLSFSVNPLLHTRCICYAWYLATVGNQDAAVVEAERAREMDPVARLPHVILAWMYYLAGRHEEARTELSEIFATNPTDVSGHRIAAWILWDEGRREEAIAEMHRIRSETRGDFEDEGSAIVVAELGSMYSETGRTSEAARLADALRRRGERGYVPPEYLAVAEAAAGNANRAFDRMQEALENRSNLGQFSILPLSRVLRQDPRYREVLERIGLGSRASELLGIEPARLPTLATGNDPLAE